MGIFFSTLSTSTGNMEVDQESILTPLLVTGPITSTITSSSETNKCTSSSETAAGTTMVSTCSLAQANTNQANTEPNPTWEAVKAVASDLVTSKTKMLTAKEGKIVTSMRTHGAADLLLAVVS